MNAIRNRRWYQFSLRTLLIIMTVCCLVPGSHVAYQEWKARRQRAAMETMERLGGTFVFGKESTSGLDLAAADIHDADLPLLADILHLERLSLVCTPVTDSGLAHVGDLTELKALYLDYTDIGDAGLKQLSGLRDLETLSLKGTQVTDAGLDHIAGLKGLNKLILSGSDASPAGVAKLRRALPKTVIYQ